MSLFVSLEISPSINCSYRVTLDKVGQVKIAARHIERERDLDHHFPPSEIMERKRDEAA